VEEEAQNPASRERLPQLLGLWTLMVERVERLPCRFGITDPRS